MLSASVDNVNVLKFVYLCTCTVREGCGFDSRLGTQKNIITTIYVHASIHILYTGNFYNSCHIKYSFMSI